MEGLTKNDFLVNEEETEEKAEGPEKDEEEDEEEDEVITDTYDE